MIPNFNIKNVFEYIVNYIFLIKSILKYEN
jgi:hypothetical protein